MMNTKRNQVANRKGSFVKPVSRPVAKQGGEAVVKDSRSGVFVSHSKSDEAVHIDHIKKFVKSFYRKHGKVMTKLAYE